MLQLTPPLPASPKNFLNFLYDLNTAMLVETCCNEF